MAKRLSKDWFELTDIRRQRFSQAARIPLYRSELRNNGDSSHKYIGYEEECVGLYSIIIANGESRRKYLEIVRGDEFNHAKYFFNAAAYINAFGVSKEADVYCGDKGEELGLKLVLQCCKDMYHKGELGINQKFILAYDLIQEGDNFYEVLIHEGRRVPNKKKQVIWQSRDNKGEVISIDIRADILKDYLAFRNASLRLCYHFHREAIMVKSPDYWKQKTGINVIFEDENMVVKATTDSSYCSALKEGCYVEGELWRGEWVERAEESKISDNGLFNQNQEDFDVWVMTEDSGPMKTKLRHNYGNDRAQENYLWFDCSVIQTLLAEHNAQIEWYGKNEGKLFLPQEMAYGAWHKEWYSAVFFHIHHMDNKAYIIAKMQEINDLNNWQKRLWHAYNVMPQEVLVQRPNVPLYNDEGRHGHFKCYDMKKIPEWRLLGAKKDRESESYHSVDAHIADAVECGGALEQCNEAFQEKFSVPLFKASFAEDKDLMRRLSRFQALNEEGLRRLAVDMVVYSIECINNKALKKLVLEGKGSVSAKDGKPFGSLNLLQELFKLTDKNEVLLRDDKKRLKILAPFFGLNDLRNSGGAAHGQTKDKEAIEECYSRIGIDRNAPHVEQGAQLLERIGKCFEQIANVLESFSQNDKREREIIQEGA